MLNVATDLNRLSVLRRRQRVAAAAADAEQAQTRDIDARIAG